MSFSVHHEMPIWRIMHNSGKGKYDVFARSAEEQAQARDVDIMGGNANGKLSWAEVDQYEKKFGASTMTADLKYDIKASQTRSWMGDVASAALGKILGLFTR